MNEEKLSFRPVAQAFRPEESAFSCACTKQIPRANTALGMTLFAFFPKSVQFQVIFFHALLLFLGVLSGAASAFSANSVASAPNLFPLSSFQPDRPASCNTLPCPQYESPQRVLPGD